MSLRASFVVVLCLGVSAGGARASGQQPPAPTGALQSDCTSTKQVELVIEGPRRKLTGNVEVECLGDMRFYADDYIELFEDQERIVAVGNVVYTQGGTRISGDRAEFNYKTRTGTFYNASGIASLGPKADRSMFGTLEPEVFFYGERLEKIGDDRYRVTNGAFTTCVQPEPRWKLTSGTTTIKLESYAVLKNSVLRVKGVPVMYLPIMYYPIKKDDRATGFLLPVYGSSTLKGQSFSNAFFWAIDRSQDATITHDWFTRTGQAISGQYRYVRAAGAEGSVTTQFLKEHAATFTQAGGAPFTTPARRSYSVNGGLTEAFGSHIRARARVSYFSSLEVQQTYNQDILQASQSTRTLGGSVTGTWGVYNINGSIDRTEYLYAATDQSVLYGAMPRISGGRAERPIGDSPLYFSVAGEYARLLRESRQGDDRSEAGLDRIDISPVLRVPVNKWPFFTINSSLAWRFTRWGESREDGEQVAVPISRRYIDMQSNLTGPIFTRVFNTPGNGYAEKFKHRIEPYLTIRRTTAVDNFERIVQLDGVDTVIGGVTQYSYGLNNRFYAKRRADGRSREILNVALRQTYYTDARASTYDPGYQSTFYGTRPQNFSPMSLTVRGSPTDGVDGSFSTEYDTHFMAFRSMTASGVASLGEWLRSTVQWSQRRFVPGLPGFDDPNRRDQFLNQGTTIRSAGNKVGGIYSFNYDLGRSIFLQQRILGYYNAQCCGFAVEYQAFDFSALGSRSPIPKDTRFNFSFTLAGIGSFSNFFGALGGSPR